MLEVRDLRQRFGEVVALAGVSFTVARGEVVGFVGRNGAGKTTTMRVILGLVAPDSGSVSWDGRVLDRAARRRIGYLPEERGLYPKQPVEEQVAFFGRLSGMDRASASASAARWIDQVGLGDRRRSPVGELSLGNQQRVQVAAAMVCEPDLAVLDEPFSGLDPIGVELLADIVRARATAAGRPCCSPVTSSTSSSG